MNWKGSRFEISGDARVRSLGKVTTKFIQRLRVLSLQAARHLQYRRQGSYSYKQHAIFSIVDRVHIFGRFLMIYVLKHEPFVEKDAG